MFSIYSLARSAVKFFSNFIFDRKRKKVFKTEKINAINEAELKNSRWGVSYSVFDGIELLEASIKQIRDEVDYINVVYQLKSWYGADCEPELYPMLLRLKDEGLIDEIIEFKPNLKAKSRDNEDKKRRLGLRYAKKARVDFFMTMDADEFYIKQEFIEAKKDIIEKESESTFCPIVDYGLTPTRRVLRNANYSVQFFFRLTPFTRLGKNSNAVAVADTTRTMAKPLFKRPKQSVCMFVEMHHMSWIRKNLESKFQNSSGKTNYTSVLNDEFFERFNTSCVDCNDMFGLSGILNK